MKFKSARVLEQCIWAMRLTEYGRSLNRSKINSLSNGSPPYDAEEARKNNIAINVNNLSLTRLAHDARSQLYNGFFTPSVFFDARTDFGPKHKRQERGVIVTKEINRIMKRSMPYMEALRSQFALQVLHGIGPACWEDTDHWCPTPLGVEDVLVPSNTLLTMRNLEMFAVWRSYTPWELHRLTQGPNRDPGWNMPVVEQAIKWASEQTMKAQGTTWAQWWSPEKWVERMKEDSGLYASDLIQTIDCFDAYWFDYDGKEESWKRAIIFDAYGGSGSWASTYGPSKTIPTKNLLDSEEGLFLYNSGDRSWASKLGEIIHFQFADLSSVSPFRYHSVRSLGFMLYAVCHLQNRLQCKFAEAVFEQLMCYLRVKSLDEVERALKVELVSRGFIDESVSFLRPDERWQPDARMVEAGMNMYDRIVQDNSSSYVQNQNFSRDRTEKTRFQVQAEVNAMMALISAALQQSYLYSGAQYSEIFRRFCKPNSADPEVREFRNRCMNQGVSEKMLVPDAWELTPERIIGGGNRTLEQTIAQTLMTWRGAYAPEGQQKILRSATLALTNDAGFTNALVPETPQLSEARHDAMLAFGSLMAGAEVEFRADTNRIDVTETLIGELALSVKRTLDAGGMTTVPQLQGYQNTVAHIEELIAQVAQDRDQQERAKLFSDALGKLTNEIKGFAQRLAEQMQAQNGESGLTPEAKSKILANIITAKSKAENQRESHGQRTAQKQVQWEAEQRRKEEEHQLEMRREIQSQRVEDVATDLRTAAEIQRVAAKPKGSTSGE